MAETQDDSPDDPNPPTAAPLYSVEISPAALQEAPGAGQARGPIDREAAEREVAPIRWFVYIAIGIFITSAVAGVALAGAMVWWLIRNL